MDDIINFLEKIPAAFWGVIVGSGFSLLAVIATNIFNDKRLARQFEHERAVRNEDRAAQMRKEIYLDAAEAIQAGIVSIANMGNTDKTIEEVGKAYTEKSSAIAKAQLIAEEKALRAITEVLTALGTAKTKLAAKRIPPMDLKRQSAQMERNIASLGELRDSDLALIKDFDLARDGGQAGLQALRERFDGARAGIAELLEQKGAVDKGVFTARMYLLEETLAEIGRLTKLVTPAMAAMRTELNFPIDGDLLEEILGDALERQMMAASELMDDLRGRIEAEGDAADGCAKTTRPD